MSKKSRTLLWFSIGVQQAGGAERLFLEGLNYFRKQGIDARLYTAGKPINERALYNKVYSPTVLLSNNSNIFNVIKIGQEISSFNPDIILLNSRTEAILIFLANLFLKTKLKYSVFIHGSFFQYDNDIEKYSFMYKRVFSRIRESDEVYKKYIPGKCPKRYNIIKRIRMDIIAILHYLSIKKAQKVFVLTEKTKLEVELLYMVKNIKVLAGAFPLNIFNYRKKVDIRKKYKLRNRKIIFSVGRVSSKKRLNLVLEGFAQSLKEDDNSTLIIGGTGPESTNLVSVAEKLGITKQVIFTGFIPDDILLDYYLACNAFINMDVADYDITNMVALALGKPIIVSDQFCFPEQLNNFEYIHKCCPNPKEIAKTILKINKTNFSPHLNKKLLLDFTWESYFSNVLNAVS